MMFDPDQCTHDVYIKGLCGNCGIKLDCPQSSSVSMVHSVPELKVSENYARQIAKREQIRLIEDRKLVLLVDLDQTILHTTNEMLKVKNDEIYTFNLWNGHPTFNTKLRPYLDQFLERMSSIYEMHIFTFACRRYAHKISSIIDADQRYFGNRILSRDESKDQFCKQGNLTNIFPCGDAMVVIIDDRADVWGNAPNLIHVKPYFYFKTSISDGAPHTQIHADLTAQLEASLSDYLNDDDDDHQCDEEEPKQESELESTKDSEVSKQEAQKPILDSEESDGSNQEPSESTQEAELESDHDDHLLHLSKTLERIHEKWFMELDAERQFLSEGERYKLPETSDIIRKYLRKK